MNYDNNRCPICGGKLKIVNVIRVDTFRRPEATQYDLSVSRRKGPAHASKISPQEWMCSSCANRLVYGANRTAPKTDAVNVDKVVLKPKKEKPKKKVDLKKRDAMLAKIFIGVILLLVFVYFVYIYHQTLADYWNKIMIVFDKILGIFNKVRSKI